jgi:hypothetical protein
LRAPAEIYPKIDNTIPLQPILISLFPRLGRVIC